MELNPNSAPNLNPNQPKKKEPLTKAEMKKLRDKHREPVRGKFIFHECPGGMLEFTFREFKEDPLERYSLIDGMVYTLPLGVAKHLNKNCWIPEYNYVQGEKGLGQAAGTGHMMRITNKVRRTSFQSLEFVDIEDLIPDVGISYVETIF